VLSDFGAKKPPLIQFHADKMDTGLVDLAGTSKWPLIIQPKGLLGPVPVSLLWWALISCGLLLSARLYQSCRYRTKASVTNKAAAKDLIKIEPIRNFDLNSTLPPVFRPFKPKYHLTMGMFEVHTSIQR
jgi:hypothetical protein